LEPRTEKDPVANGPGDTPAAKGDAHQGEMPFAVVLGQPYTEVPHDLYIPPDALEVILEAFEGPLDLLLYLIRRQNLNILDIPIAEITRQYIEYIELLKDLQFELASEYLVMAAILAEIKSRMLLPKPGGGDEEEEDPRAELVRRLQEYERFKQAAEDLDALPRAERDFFVAAAHVEERSEVRLPPEVDLRELLTALKDVMSRAELFMRHAIQREPLSIRERMSLIMTALSENPYIEFPRLFTAREGRLGVVVSFLALMELTRERLVDVVQNEPMGQIYVRLPETTE
jgi:segregation and condensation protein A